LYNLFIVMTVQRQAMKKIPVCLHVTLPAAIEEMLHKQFNGTPKESVKTIFLLGKLAYCGFFDWYSNKEGYRNYTWTNKWKDPKIIFTKDDLTQCDIETADWDGYGLLKVTHTYQLPTDTITYNFAHLTIQEFLCVVYISTLTDQYQQLIMSKHFDDYPNLFIYLCGLTRLVCPAISQFVFEKLKSSSETDVVTALRCVYESTKTDPPQSATPFELNLSSITLQPYDCLCVGYVLSYYPVTKVDMSLCDIDDNGAVMLAKIYNGHTLQELVVWDNDLTLLE